ncbi:MAG: T9SS type A sorting domain-containing protein [Flavobacteriales bacterium]|nr:T9SS type A sorting domain-containing protein [Flavobacteriales bacterium]
MKHTLTLLAAVVAGSLAAQTVNTTGSNTFSPAVLTINLGQTVTFNVGSGHTATEVSQATWNANGTTSNGGFNFAPGTHTFTPSTAGTYYYVCQPHASMGMKGQIIVDSGVGMDQLPAAPALTFAPNPASDVLRIEGAPAGSQLSLVDAGGRILLDLRLEASGQIDISAMPAGLYVIRLMDAQGALLRTERLTVAR